MKRSPKNIEAQFSLSASAMLSVGDAHGPVRVNATGVDGLLPGCGELHGERRLLEAAYQKSSAKVVMFDLTFQVTVIGFNKTSGAIFVPTAQIFCALAKRARAYAS
jgi:hypothetical protein